MKYLSGDPPDMSIARDIPLSRKFVIAFGAVCLLCVAQGLYSFLASRSIAEKTRDVSTDAFPSVVLLSNARADMNQLRREDFDVLLCQNPACTDKHTHARQLALDEYQTWIRQYEAFISYPGERELYAKLTADFGRYLEVSNRGMALIAGNKMGDAMDTLTGDDTVNLFAGALKDIGDDLDLKIRQGTEQADGHRAGTVPGRRG